MRTTHKNIGYQSAVALLAMTIGAISGCDKQPDSKLRAFEHQVFGSSVDKGANPQLFDKADKFVRKTISTNLRCTEIENGSYQNIQTGTAPFNFAKREPAITGRFKYDCVTYSMGDKTVKNTSIEFFVISPDKSDAVQGMLNENPAAMGLYVGTMRFERDSSSQPVERPELATPQAPVGTSGKAAGAPEATPAKNEIATGPFFVPLDPFTVNLQSDGAEQYLQTAMTLEIASKEQVDLLKTYMPKVRGQLLGLLSSKKADEINNPAGKEKLVKEITTSLNQLLTRNGQVGQVTDVSFTTFVTQ